MGAEERLMRDIARGSYARSERAACEDAAKHQTKRRARKTRRPSVATMERWMWEGIARAVDGCRCDVDGCCEHGSPSWLIKLGVI